MIEFFTANPKILLTLSIVIIAGLANMTPVFLKHLPVLNQPIDGGRVYVKDGRRILGDGKTWKGLIGGTVIATLFGSFILNNSLDFVQFSFENSTISMVNSIVISGCIGLFALVGDSVKSFVKRRKNIQRGESWVPWDQTDWILGASAGVIISDGIRSIFLLKDITFKEFFESSLFLSLWVYFIPTIAISFLLHLLVKWIGFKLSIENKAL
jgi:CDP-archaeol synthase